MTERPAPEVGETFGGYTIESVLDRGGMGSVFLATHERLARKVALKVIAPELAHDQDFRARFLQESQLAASLDHPNVIPIYDADEVDGVLYLAMRYVSGPSLQALIRQRGRLSPEETLRIAEQIGGALDAAHKAGLVHRDVKPANILVADPDLHAYLSDFGLAKRTSSQGITRAGSFLGTVDYSAPEQIQGRHVDGRADVYSLGVVVFHCLAGEPPFVRETDAAVLGAHLLDPPPALSSIRPDLPRSLDPVLSRAMAKEPAARYPTAGAFAGALGAALREPATAAAATHVAADIRPGETRVLGSPATSRRGRRWLVVAAVAAALAGGAVATVLATQGDGGGTAPPPTLRSFVDRVEGILKQSAAGRRRIGNALADGLACRTTPDVAARRLQEVVANRRSVLSQLATVSAPTAQAARSVKLLRAAIRESIDVDVNFRDGFRAASRCPVPDDQSFAAARAADVRATVAKRRFVSAFNPLAERLGRRTWRASEI